MMMPHQTSLSCFPEAIRFYCGLGEQRYNYHPVFTGPYACVSPICGTVHKKVNQVAVPEGALVIQDSGAFNDACVVLRGERECQLTLRKQHRLSLKEALKRQEQHAETFGYTHQIEARASYDVLIDETWTESEAGIFICEKRRWSETEAELAIDETVAAAAFLNQHRNGMACVFSAQGVTPRQYLRCVERILPYLRAGDILGLGGFCILGKRPWLLPAFRETMHLVIPFLKREGVRRVHLWGVCFAEALGLLLWLCDHDEDGAWDEHRRIAVSNDSVGPSIRPVRKDRQTGYAVWGYASWRNDRYAPPPVLASCKQIDANGNKAPTCPPETRCRGLERARHIACTADWLAHFREREPRLYHPSRLPAYRQLSFLEGNAGMREGVSA